MGRGPAARAVRYDGCVGSQLVGAGRFCLYLEFFIEGCDRTNFLPIHTREAPYLHPISGSVWNFRTAVSAVPRSPKRALSVLSSPQCLAVRGRGSWSAAFRRPQFRQANTVMASPASKSTARSGNIVPRHLSQVFMGGDSSTLRNACISIRSTGHSGVLGPGG